jgi:hypothetical protein
MGYPLCREDGFNLVLHSLLGLASVVTLTSKSRRTRDMILPHLRLSFLFVTRMATVEVFQHASTQG